MQVVIRLPDMWVKIYIILYVATFKVQFHREIKQIKLATELMGRPLNTGKEGRLQYGKIVQERETF